jgi:BirA family transcriptional regulator, biotin operon repressor / biotin---[acetyl-CoA-carboxylase] ligase
MPPKLTPFDAAIVRAAFPRRRIDFFDSIPSTMSAAAALPHPGDCAVADHQSAGQGRHGNSWHSEPSSGLYCTVVLQPKISPDLLPIVTLSLGLACQEVIADVTNIQADIRWPNDLMIGNRKTGGILTQLHNDRVLAGIGINVNHSALPASIDATATSLRIFSGRIHSREHLFIALLPAIDRMLDILATEGRGAILNLFSQNSSYVRVDVAAAPAIQGRTAGLTAEGYLLVEGDDGKTHTILAGGVRPALD